jgi:hypothetical protein
MMQSCLGLMLPDESVLSAIDGLLRAAFRAGHGVAARIVPSLVGFSGGHQFSEG